VFPIVLLAGAALTILWPWSSSQAQAADVAAIFTGTLAVLAGAALMLTNRIPSTLSRGGIAWWLFLGWALVGALASGRGWSAFAGEPTSILGWFTLASLTLVGIAAFTVPTRIHELLVRFGWLMILFECLIALGQIATSGPANVGGTVHNSTTFGEAILLFLPWALVDAPGRSGTETWARRITVFVALVTLAAIGSRTAVALALVWVVWFVLTRARLDRRVRLGIAGGSIAAVALAAYGFARGEVLSSTSISTLGLRPALWMLSLRAVAARPLWGWGPDGFTAGGSAVSTVALAKKVVLPVFQLGSTDPHNALAWIAVSTGVVGLLLFGWFVFELVRVWRVRVLAGEDATPAVWAVVMSFVVFLTAPAALQVLPMFALVCGVSMARSQPTQEPVGIRMPRWIAFTAIGLLTFTSATFALNMASRAPLETANAERSPGLVASAQAASQLWPLDPHLAYLTSLHWGYAALVNPESASARTDLVAIDRATRLDRTSARNALELVRTLRSYSATNDAVEKAFAETFRRYPFDPLARAEYGLYLAQTGRSSEAREQLAIASLGDQTGAQDRQRIIAAAREVLESQ